MVLDAHLTSQVPENWEIWKTSTKFQAIKKGATESDEKTYGPMRKHSDDAIRDAKL